MIKFLQTHLGVPLTAIIIGALIFTLPKIIYDDIALYKQIGQSISQLINK